MLTNLKRIKKDIEELAQFNSTPGWGLTRFSLTKAEREARQYLKDKLKELELEVYEDQAGSLFGRMEGSKKDGPVIMIGSHFDSVKKGGNFDGPAGVVMALEVMRVLKEEGVQPEYPIEFVAMIEEEGGRFGSGVFGSRAMVGEVSYQDLLENKDQDSISMASAFKEYGYNPAEIETARRDPEEIKAFIELHIEQGPVLEKKNKDLGLVDFVVGINEFKVTVKGQPDHAGTTPMNMRKDALSSVAEIISQIKDFAKKAGKGTVATVGSLDISPGAANIVPGEVQFTVDIRSKDSECITQVKNDIESALSQMEEKEEVSWSIDEMLRVEPVKLSPDIIDLFEKKAKDNDFSYEKMISGAGHDAMIMSAITDVGLIFVPSRDGRSHCPEEWTDFEDLQKGIELIYQTVLKLGGEQ
jgi:allantoate deiminase